MVRLPRPSERFSTTPLASCAVLVVWLISGLLATPSPADARITRIEVVRVESPTFDGLVFGSAGRYEKLVCRAYGEIDPADPRNTIIVDVALAPRNARGRVEYVTDLLIIRPIDLSKGNHRIILDINNRGDGRTFASFNDVPGTVNNPTTGADAGIGFLMRQGYTIVGAGWDATASQGQGRLTIKVPTVRAADGSPIAGLSLQEFVIDNDTTTTGTLTYRAATLDKSSATLTARIRYHDDPVPVPAAGWEYVDAGTIRLLPAGTPFLAGRLYEFVYPATDPILAGAGFAAIRDVAAFLHHDTKDERGTANPLAGDVQFIYTFCLSQPCRAMHDFIYLGFNQDESGRRVLDGVLNWLGGGSGIFANYRFGQPGVTHRQHIGRWFPEFQFPFANQVLTDPVTGKTDGRLRRCLESGTCPKIFEVNSENEYWSKAMAGLHVDGRGQDLDDPPNVRSYFMSSLPHGAGGPGKGICQQERNPLSPNPVLRALLVALDQWVTGSIEPPASRMPRRGDGTLVPPLPQSGVGFPNIPGVVYNGRPHTGDWFDYGATFDQGIVTKWPPVLRGTPYPMFVPKTDADGNNIAGIRLPDVAVPLATYTGWALRAVPEGGNDGCDAAGQRIAFMNTKTERLAAGDPRLSIEERYPSHDVYVRMVTEVASRLRSERFFLAEDVDRAIAAAAARTVGFMRPSR
ncbi:MAG TPA: alpha/beta hydrolase domain-containing protein [Planctomycetaceae bacterium]|nr:alpha/beta hydrolase domain-containing protein [Planctomycetaceae bacterium]